MKMLNNSQISKLSNYLSILIITTTILVAHNQKEKEAQKQQEWEQRMLEREKNTPKEIM